MKVLCTGAPRSGTSMVNLIMTYFYDLKVFMNGTPNNLWEEADLFTTQQRTDGLIWNDYIQPKKHPTDFADEGIKVIYIYRDGRDCLISKRRGYGEQYWYGPEIEEVDKWIKSSEVMVDVIKNGYENIHVIKYEDLVENHVEEIRKIEDFLGLKIDNRYTDFYKDFKDYENMSVDGAIGTEHTELRPIEPNSGNWKKEKHKERMLEILTYTDDLEKVLIDLGYEENNNWVNELIDPITFVIPSRNNLDLLKLAYKSIRDLKGNHHVLVLDDASEDGTGDWLESMIHSNAAKGDNGDNHLHVHTNPGPERVGIVGMFDKGIEMAQTDIIMAFHADMVAGKALDTTVLRHLKPGKVVSATRVEPSLHPPGPEKVIEDFGLMPDEFNYSEWRKYKIDTKKYVTNGIFAPWAIFKEDFLSIGGHDELFAPQSREDSDLFNRFLLKGYELLQTWEGFVYHFTSRGSRFNKYSGGDIGKDSPEWQATNAKNMRNFIRKWKTMVQHDPYMLPLVDPIYDVGFVVENGNVNALSILEPWCNDIYGDWVGHKGFSVNKYIDEEQPKTTHNLSSKIHSDHVEPKNDVIIKFDAEKMTNEDVACIQKLGAILEDSGKIGEMKLGNLHFTIKKLQQIQHKNIHS